MLTAIADRLWVAEQPLRFYGLPIFSRMTIMALPNQDLIVISPITPRSQLTQSLDQIGTVRYVIAPDPPNKHQHNLEIHLPKETVYRNRYHQTTIFKLC
jgi:hypothetical protein